MNVKPLLALWCVAALGLAQAQQSPTLRKIREAGVITIAYRESSVPFSYLDDAQRPVGYSMAICDRIVDAVKARLQLPDLERRYVAVTSATRVPLVANGTVDLECGVTTNNVERQRQVAFTVTTYVAASRLVSKKTAPIVRLEDMRGKVVTSTVGTTSLRHLQELYASRGLTMTILAARDDPDAFRLVETDRAAGYAMDDVLLAATVARSRQPGDYLISEDALSVEPYGIMLSKEDRAFKRLADDAIVALFKSGDIHKLYRRWFESPIPPNGINLSLPMSAAMRRVVEHPTDSPDPATYR
ncbi:amino acid ABC transporter substrate-binding protein [Ideonella sp. BN130291]|uniref:amino acid ABC transporter substrate-binding protein n=1 Tax=Ideonella sp. BN130291 TaxID=3112940 RepID=UPI002E2754CF|nr:amino acid ABC transporter substrate-binding protein [Ideonella sp. BN130291]